MPNTGYLQSIAMNKGSQSQTIPAVQQIAPAGLPPSVDQRADACLQMAANVSELTEAIFSAVRGGVTSNATEPVPSRCGLDGKIMDATERLEFTHQTLIQLRDYLLGA